MLETTAHDYLIDRVYLGIYGYEQLRSFDLDDNSVSSKYSSTLKIILFALIAVEKFSHTSESKHILWQGLTITNEKSKMNVLEHYEPWTKSNNCVKRQIGNKINLLENLHLPFTFY